MKPLVVIPARGGSKGVPRKNIKLLNGKPLIQYTIDAARAVFDDSVICVSTDDEEIKSVVESVGLSVPFIRPTALATDSAGTYEVLLHAIQYYENSGYNPDTLILLQATSPLRNAQHIKEAMQLFDDSCEMVVSVKETKSNPYFVLKEENILGFLENSKIGSFKTRQDCPKVWELNGAIFLIDVEILKIKRISEFTKVKKYEMSQEHSIDIDEMLDFELASLILNKNRL
ncbi:acylneuraminate cytidylyltransferase family protein [Algoriphagus confluentis]|uniref:Acylneuraminate cytidylyltransferase family protein n=1 Tax=Algoriphagus confluentis TaxID=1697556 RepID=A0ABQ6PIN0_9BACT|nr:acylneuraminate cytidylyltransferase family protein [Algoriphagus confluentis]